MRKQLLYLLTVVSMMLVCGVSSAWAQTAISENYTFIAQTAMNGAAANNKTDLGGYIVCASSNNSGYAENKGKSTINGVEYFNCMQIKENRGITFKVASPCTMTIYGQTNGTRTFILSETEKATGALYTCPSTGGVYDIEIGEENVNKVLHIIASGDLYLAGLSFSFTQEEIEENDVTIKSLTINGAAINPSIEDNTVYNMLLPFETSTIPTIAVSTKNEKAKVETTNPTTLPGTATIKVTAADNITTAEYRVNYTLSDRALTSVMFSNNFDGFINDNKIKAYYLENTEVPEISKVTPVADGVTSEISDGKLIVKSAFATVEYTIETEAVAPYTGGDKTFDGTETWIKSGYSYDNNKGWRFAKNVEEENNRRISNGSTRIYFFLDACEEITLATASGCTSARNIIVYRDGEKLSTPTQAPKYESGKTNSITIAGNPDAPSMIAIVSNQTGGDGGFGSFTIKKVEKSQPYTLNAKNTEYYGLYLDYAAAIPEGVTAYTGTLSDDETTLTVKAIDGNIVPANCAVLVKAAKIGEYTFEESDATVEGFASDLKGVTANTDVTALAETGKVVLTLGLKDGVIGFRKPAGTQIMANKTYLLVSEVNAAKGVKIAFGGETTGISEIDGTTDKANEAVYDLTGRRVSADAKGLLIKNGKKFINK